VVGVGGGSDEVVNGFVVLFVLSLWLLPPFGLFLSFFLNIALVKRCKYFFTRLQIVSLGGVSGALIAIEFPLRGSCSCFHQTLSVITMLVCGKQIWNVSMVKSEEIAEVNIVSGGE
jgi:hypothetical protein